MENEVQRKIAWLEKRYEDVSKTIQSLENDRRYDRSTRAQKIIRDAKKEKLRLKDHIAWMKKIENQSQKN